MLFFVFVLYREKCGKYKEWIQSKSDATIVNFLDMIFYSNISFQCILNLILPFFYEDF